MSSKKVPTRLRVNGEDIEVYVPPNRLLIEVLREDLNLTGTKLGCDDGSCGACTILVNGIPCQCCMMLAVSYQDSDIRTVEGLARNGKLDPLQKAFCEAGGQQCGFCTPGLLMAARALLLENTSPTVEEISQALAGNLCRCTGYTKIIAAVQQAAREYQENRAKEPERIAI
ncbi:MAG TPA: (2Fe-2S)-binding protein [Acidobacteriota bacterium]|nr:(2Fe-2S)-binding protein [Acidobacteriota bacterium]